ncbi:MAG: phosphodiesterase [Candidatus Binatia bacterium]
MIIAQITDLHVVAKGQLCYGQMPTNARLGEAVAHINALRPRPDVVIASGDLTDNGTEEEYACLRDILAALIPPLYVIPGNHDQRDALLRAFADHAYLPRPGAPFAHFAIDAYPVRLIGVDTSVPGHHHGLMCDQRLAWLDATLAADSQRPTLIFMHHPPFRTGVRWMDASGLHGGRKMEAIIARHPQIQRVVCGHIHRLIQAGWGGTVACTAPSTCHQVALNLGETGGYEFALEPPAVQLHVLDPGYGIVSHLSYVSGNHETISPPAPLRAQLVAAALQGYAELCLTEFDVRR